MKTRHFFSIFFLIPLLCLSINAAAETLRLEDAVQLALNNHQRIQQAQETSSASEAAAESAAGQLLPSIDFSFSYNRLNDNPYQNIGGYPLTTGDTDRFHYQISATQPLFTGFNLTARKKLAELDVNIAHYDLQQARRQLALDVHIAGLQLLQAESLQRLAEQQCAQLKHHLADVKAAYDQGMVPGNDRLKAEVALATAEQRRHSVSNRVTLTRSRLNLLLSRPQNSPLTLVEPQTLAQPQQSLPKLTAIAIEQRPEILIAKTAVSAAEQTEKLARSNHYPHIALVASYWRDGDNVSASHNTYSNENNAAIGLHLNWNLFSGGTDRSRVIASQHQHRAKQLALLELEDNVRLQVEEAFRDISVAASNEKTAAKALEQARENHRLSTLQFNENLISTSDLLDAQTLLTQADANLQTAHYGFLLAQAKLSFALGQDPSRTPENN